MAALTITAAGGAGAIATTLNTLTASDTFTYVPGDIMHLRNATAGALTPNLDGADGTVVGVSGVGNVSVAAGITLASIAAAGERVIYLDTIAAYLLGLVTVTGGVGIICTILRR